MIEILELLEKDSRITVPEIAVCLGKTEEEVANVIEEYEKQGVIVGYTTMINWEKTEREKVTALIEVKITPKQLEGFDRAAERIYKFPEVTSCYLMSGGFDLTVIIEGKTMKEVAMFVSQKLAPLESVLSTSTHFVLKKYKDKGRMFSHGDVDGREAIFL